VPFVLFVADLLPFVSPNVAVRRNI
jgi:hypothetical protein